MLEHQSMVFSIALRMLADRGMAEEVAQDVFLELHTRLPELESAEHVLFWLRRVTTHRAIDALRRRRSRPETPMDWHELPEIPDRTQPVDEDGWNGQLQQLVASLPAVPRSIVVLRYQEEMGPEEIAAALQMPVATVKSHLQRSLRLLREKAARVERPLERQY
ncbi:RNA polymerase sigma factor [Silvibacterium sp.]|uniref:RNA polymerase sigma factor n=1 Tax=Silvibacterium sp. TaxID=1964179 RepID=UPI0039E55DFA